jgi:hypothetical protein
VSLQIAVPRLWLLEGRSIEIELPRNLVCANCSGGGCGHCQQSGAITVRGRGELPELVQVCLPEQASSDTQESMLVIARRDSNSSDSGSASRNPVRPLTIRIPECGGLPEPGSTGIVRGCLFLHVGIAEQPSAHVRLIDDDAPLSSSKMIHAEAKRVLVHKPERSQTTESAGSRVLDLEDEASDGEERPPSTRIAKVRSIRASDAESLKRASRECEDEVPLVIEPGSHGLSRRPNWFFGVLSAVVVVVVALWVWSRR